MMNNYSTKLLVLNAICLLLFASSTAQEAELIEPTGAYVNFDLKKAPNPNYGRQELSLYGCNTEVTTRSRYWNRDINLQWGVDNQIFNEVPFGEQLKDGRSYYVSKYYMASPPVMKMPYNGKKVNIGLVLPDHFTLFGDNPAQMVRLDYSVLEPVYLNYIKVNYDTITNTGKSCTQLGVNLVPLNIECKDFAWREDGPTPNARGASGVARIKNEASQNQVFLPSYQDNDKYLNCSLTILDDIMLKHDVSFLKEDGSLVKSINLTEYYSINAMKGTEIQLVCKARTVPPSGCKNNNEVIVIER
ncbi:MAG: hypothetical protein ACJARP_002147 [Vicingaceae bacterium]|jgi:hypothetical protein